MTDHTQARAEGRAEGIRECLAIAQEALTGDADGRDIYTAILALLDTPIGSAARAGGRGMTVPAVPLTDDVVDKIAREIGLIVAHHIETMYPAAAEAVAWESCKRSIQGVVRNSVKSAGRAAETGAVDEWVKQQRAMRRTKPAPMTPVIQRGIQ